MTTGKRNRRHGTPRTVDVGEQEKPRRSAMSHPVGLDIAQILQNADEYHRAFAGGVNAPFMMEG